jgi:hypothetical protein
MGRLTRTGPPRARPGGASASTPYPDFDVTRADKLDLDWDEKTTDLIGRRLRDVPGFRFFDPGEVRLLEAVCDRLLPQDDRPPEWRIPVPPWIDDRLARGESEGYRYDEMPDDGTAYRLGLVAVDRTAAALHGAGFPDLPAADQDDVLAALGDGRAPADCWPDLPAERFFRLVLNDVLSYYYAHPDVWAEIGFNGPASPRGHLRLDLDRRDPWEAAERRPRSSVEIVRRAPGPRGAAGQPAH